MLYISTCGSDEEVVFLLGRAVDEALGLLLCVCVCG
jgi:hypothetical protein